MLTVKYAYFFKRKDSLDRVDVAFFLNIAYKKPLVQKTHRGERYWQDEVLRFTGGFKRGPSKSCKEDHFMIFFGVGVSLWR